jgi:hypothetical protein
MAARIVMIAFAGLILAGFVALGVMALTHTADGPCDGPIIKSSECGDKY